MPIANDATCRLYGLRLAFISVLHKRFIGEVLPIKILRNGEEMVVDVELKCANPLYLPVCARSRVRPRREADGCALGLLPSERPRLRALLPLHPFCVSA